MQLKYRAKKTYEDGVDFMRQDSVLLFLFKMFQEEWEYEDRRLFES